MTFKEKYRKEHGSAPDSMLGYGCPYKYGYEADAKCPTRVMYCDECWDREMPDTEPAECAKLPTDENISVVSSQTPAVNCANCEKLEEEIARLNERILEDGEYIDKLREKVKDKNEELDLYRLIFWTVESTLKIELPDVHTWRETH